MSYLILPSARVFQIQQANKLVLIPNFYAEEILINANNIAACFYIKNVSVYQLKQLTKPLFTHSYPKKISCICYHSLQNDLSIIVSDKFGDIYQMNDEKPKFLNSNLGIPTFIHCYKKYLILGDELNKIKIYNLENPHQIFSIWYIIDCSPLKIIEVSEGIFVLLAKYKQKDTLKQADRVYIFDEKQLLQVDFPGKAIYEGKNHSVSLSEQQTVTHIIKLAQNKFSLLILQKQQLIALVYQDNKLTKQITQKITPQKQPWEFINAAYEESSNCLYVSFGIDVDYEGEINVEQVNFVPEQQEFQKKLNEIETIARIQLI